MKLTLLILTISWLLGGCSSLMTIEHQDIGWLASVLQTASPQNEQVQMPSLAAEPNAIQASQTTGACKKAAR